MMIGLIGRRLRTSESGLEFLALTDAIDGALQALGKVLDIGAGAEAPVVGARVQSGLDGRACAIALSGRISSDEEVSGDL
jgi:hypothetical protein